MKVDQLLDDNKNQNESELGKTRPQPNLEGTEENFSEDYDGPSGSGPGVSPSYVSPSLLTKAGKNDPATTTTLDGDTKSMENTKEGLKKGISREKAGSKA